ncbi:RNA binding protein (contains ribosomal protein S1 domain) [Legionella parisiensis]|uniref:Uncharacterized protein n=2 Tax=Legionella parisiensis TaxID=45071 RepID=A0A1E5JLY5_9GAMM|nr:RNA binding protein (contains ribosomal protein S1 domain) [Legionella parisiensis]OEH45539.1 hypothetical protein lpari_03498 [Legionella parisiensis]STX72249.1 RNA binding protein (contains ribosomal protein S1 domain) [Legionella parisiensis]
MCVILYIPFPMSVETDLIELAINWDNQKLEQHIRIIRHGEDNLEIPEDELLEIYIIGHGICNPEFIQEHGLYHHICAGPELGYNIISIEEVAKRYQQDFFFYKNNIQGVKLYFCNLTDSNEYIAQIFQQSLVDTFQNIKINHYEGILFGPDNKGHKYSKDKNSVVSRASERRLFIYKPENKVNDDFEYTNRLRLFKQTSMSYEDSIERRSNKQLERRRENRNEEFNSRRRF